MLFLIEENAKWFVVSAPTAQAAQKIIPGEVLETLSSGQFRFFATERMRREALRAYPSPKGSVFVGAL